jgi:flagella basal body P-ring formation protein FlgA
MKQVSVPLLALCALAAASPLRAQSDALQDVERIRTVAATYIEAQLQPQTAGAKLYVEAGALDARLRLPACEAPAAFLPPGAKIGARTTVGVRCTVPGWSVYVPVTVESELAVLVLRQPAARGAALTPADVESQVRRVPGFATLYLTSAESLAGRHLKTAATPGTALTAELLANDLLIRRGQRVTLVAATGNFEVRAQGEAIADASPSGRVRVQNLASLKVVEGQAESSNLVRVGP